MRILVTGSKAFTDRNLMVMALRHSQAGAADVPTLIVGTDKEGTDRLARQVAVEEFGWAVEDKTSKAEADKVVGFMVEGGDNKDALAEVKKLVSDLPVFTVMQREPRVTRDQFTSTETL